jgi:hypothetical protein
VCLGRELSGQWVPARTGQVGQAVGQAWPPRYGCRCRPIQRHSASLIEVAWWPRGTDSWHAVFWATIALHGGAKSASFAPSICLLSSSVLTQRRAARRQPAGGGERTPSRPGRPRAHRRICLVANPQDPPQSEFGTFRPQKPQKPKPLAFHLPPPALAPAPRLTPWARFRRRRTVPERLQLTHHPTWTLRTTRAGGVTD